VNKRQILLGKALGFGVDGFALFVIQLLTPLNIEVANPLLPVGDDAPFDGVLSTQCALVKGVQRAVYRPDVAAAVWLYACA
jgi:hypothetical protein